MALKYSELHPGLVVTPKMGGRWLRLTTVGPDKGSNIMITGVWLDAPNGAPTDTVSGLLTLADWVPALWDQPVLEPAP